MKNFEEMTTERLEKEAKRVRINMHYAWKRKDWTAMINLKEKKKIIFGILKERRNKR